MTAKSLLLLDIDSYKHSHWAQLPPGTKTLWAYLSSRWSKVEGIDSVILYGLSDFLENLPLLSEDAIEEAGEVVREHFGRSDIFNHNEWREMLWAHEGHLPLIIAAVEEGRAVPHDVPMIVVRNVGWKYPWLTTFIETALMRHVWYGSTVATLAAEIRRLCLMGLRETSDEPEIHIDFMLHDFGSRGVSSRESSILGGRAHMLSFDGTDNLAALASIPKEHRRALSIPASEHSTMTAWGRERELEAYRNMVGRFGDQGFACVSDSYDLHNAVGELWGGELACDVLKARKVVIRPDSGNPISTPVEVVKLLMDRFGSWTNNKGYDVLPPNIRVIQGDGITIESIPLIIANMKANKLSLENISFGMGGGLLQQVNRDTFGFAMKASAVEDENGWRAIGKEAPGKTSLKGKVYTYSRGGELFVRDLLQGSHWAENETPAMKQVYYCGLDRHDLQSYDEARARVRARDAI